MVSKFLLLYPDNNDSFYILRVKKIPKSGLLPPASARGNKAQTNSGALAQKTAKDEP